MVRKVTSIAALLALSGSERVAIRVVIAAFIAFLLILAFVIRAVLALRDETKALKVTSDGLAERTSDLEARVFDTE